MGKMAALQKFCLKWNNFQNSVTSVFENLRQDEELVDITLCCEGQKIKAHRMMLSACSPYFRDLLKENPCQHPVFFLKDTSYPDLAAVVEFVYKGEVNVLQSQLGSFLKTAEMLQVKGLSGDDDDDGPGRPTPTAVAASPAEPRGIEPRPRPASSPLRSRVREPPDCRPSSPRSKRRRLSGSDSRVGSQSPLPPVSSAPPPLPAAPLPPATIDLEPPPAAAALETPLDARPVAHQPPPPPPPPLAPHHSAQPHGDDGYNIKVEKVDIPDGDDDASLETALGQVSNMEASQFEGSDHSASSHDMAGLLSRLSEQGGSGDLSVGGAAGTSEDGSSQGRVSTVRFECETCGQTFSQRTNLCHHRAVHQGRTRCPLCGRVFSRTSGLSAHLARRHGDQHQAPGGPHQPCGDRAVPHQPGGDRPGPYQPQW
ncbi:broad-complex core protein isoforms 1/2/3/4/5-like isoform X6 [Amphibalanus amphitrite]|uniref:broad-complex core protein isoforms 1/2/3/4/5-like isoform X6 n=1 Tax=Amphibalanus amphitrite TaxID=1232801 RepID=UPI001C91DC8F|nr:broad-complex core protein isoforms 1/2/3/4/5-like isoform X6 [Amphibalanus amphitrite]